MIADLMDDAHQYTIPLQLEGVVSYFEYTLPTSAEYEDENIPHLELMADSPAWEPYDDDFALLEESHLNFRGNLISVTSVSTGTYHLVLTNKLTYIQHVIHVK